MEKLIKLRIDGREVQAPVGMNLIEAAELSGIHIPNLCYLKGMKGIGACRLCLVEVEGLKAPVIACNTKVKDDMVVHTRTERVQEIRRFVIDLILSMHPLDCVTCTKASDCNLQQYAYDFGLKESSFSKKRFTYSVDEGNPFVKRDPQYCILCGRCVRVCKEQGTNVLDFMGRGIESKVVTANDMPLHESGCTFCGSCLDVCPVSALREADRERKGREWEYARTDSVCLLCGCGCDITVSTKDEMIQKINAGNKAPCVEQQFICAYGRFGYDFVDAGSRITAPMLKTSGELQEVSWKEALKHVANILQKAGKDTGFISVAGIQNEDALMLKRFAGDVLKTQNVDTTVSLYARSEHLEKSEMAEMDQADLIVLVGMDPSQWTRVLPALDVAVRRRTARKAKLIVIDSGEPRIAQVADIHLAGDEILNIKGLIKAAADKEVKLDQEIMSLVGDVVPDESIRQAAEIFAQVKEPLILAAPSFFHAASNLALIKGRVAVVPLEGNARGVVLMGLKPEGRTYQEMSATNQGLTQRGKSGVKVLYALGEVPMSKRPDGLDFLVVQGSHFTALAREADVVLPAATYLESSGSIIDYLGELKTMDQAVAPRGESKSHRDIFIQLARIMGETLQRPTQSEIKKAAGVRVKLAPADMGKQEDLDVSPQAFLEAVNASVLNTSRLLWLKESGMMRLQNDFLQAPEDLPAPHASRQAGS